MLAFLWPLLIYWFILFVICYVIVEVGQDQFYDEVTPRASLKVAAGTLVFAALATRFRPSFETMFTADLPWTVLQAMVWLGVFIFVFQFHPPHALAISTVAMVLLTGLATLGVDSLTKPAVTLAPIKARGAPPVRKTVGPAFPPPGAPAK